MSSPAELPGFAILVINPGSTSTKISLFRDEEELRTIGVAHEAAVLARFPSIAAQREMRMQAVESFLADCPGAASALHAVIGRGGLLHPLPSGTYVVDRQMLGDLEAARFGEHASNLGAPLAYGVAASRGCPAYVADPVVVDEMEEVARLSGIPEIPRRSVFHALNQKSAAREVAGRLGRPYEECSLIVAHLGGGVSVGAHRGGRVVDVNNALDGDGPFSAERSGGVPVGALLELFLSGRQSPSELRRRIVGGGGLVAYCGTNDLRKVREAARRGDGRASLALQAMVYQIAKEIAMHGATLEGKVDRIVLTGGMAQDAELVASIAERVRFLAPVEVVPGEREMLSLARNALAVLRGELRPLRYGTAEEGA